MALTALESELAAEELSVEAYLDSWMESAKPRYRYLTFRGFQNALQKVISMKGQVPLAELDASDIEEMATQLQSEGINPRVAWQYLGVFRKAIKAAVREEILSVDPFQTISVHHRIQQATEEEVEKARRIWKEQHKPQNRPVPKKKMFSPENLALGAFFTKDSPLREFLPVWVVKRQDSCNEKTYKNHKTACRNILRFAGEKRLGDLQPEDIEHLAEEIVASGVKENTAWRYLATLRAAMNTAIEQGILEASPFRDIRMQEKLACRDLKQYYAELEERRARREALEKERQERREARAVRKAEQAKRHEAWVQRMEAVAARRESEQEELLQKGKEQWERILSTFPKSAPLLGYAHYLPLRLGACCGLTVEEALGLTWEDVDFENCTIHVHQKMLTNAYYSEPLYGPVHETLERWVKIPEDVMTDLRRWKSFQEKAGIRKRDLVCVSIEGRPVIKRDVLPTLRKLGISQPSLWSYSRRTVGIAVNK